jgi:hypothetical protein
MAYIHSGGSGSGRSPLITRSYQPSPANSRHSLSSPRSTLTRNKKVADVMSSSADASPLLQQGNLAQLPHLFKRLQANASNIPTTSHYAPSIKTPNIITNPLMDRAIQSSLPSLMDDEHRENKNQVTVGSYQRLGVNLNAECVNPRTNNGHSPQSSVGDGDTTDYAHCDPGEGSNSDGSRRSSDAEDRDSSFYAEADFANCIARAAQNTGFTFNESSFVIEPQQPPPPPNRKFRHHQRAHMPNFRPTSPYSTDSNMSAAVHQTRHPPKFRKRQAGDRAINQLPSPSSGSEHTAYYDLNQSDFLSHHQQIKVPTSMQNGNCKKFSQFSQLLY